MTLSLSHIQQQWMQALAATPDDSGEDQVEEEAAVQVSDSSVEANKAFKQLELECITPTCCSFARAFAIYADAYEARLDRALADDFPALQRLLGRRLFSGMAVAYRQFAPPAADQLLYFYGDGLADYLLACQVDWRWLELARYEALRRQLLFAPQCAAFRIEKLQQADVQAWQQQILVWHPAVRMVAGRGQVEDWYRYLLSQPLVDDGVKMSHLFDNNHSVEEHNTSDLLIAASASAASSDSSNQSAVDLPPAPAHVDAYLLWRNSAGWLQSQTIDPRWIELDNLLLARGKAGVSLDEICQLAPTWLGLDDPADIQQQVVAVLLDWLQIGLFCNGKKILNE